MEKLYYHDNECPATPVEQGRALRQVKARGGSLMMVEVRFQPGTVSASHSHAHEQITYVAAGSFDFIIGERSERLLAGDTVYIPSGAMHNVVCIEAGTLVDTFTPQRQDFLS